MLRGLLLLLLLRLLRQLRPRLKRLLRLLRWQHPMYDSLVNKEGLNSWAHARMYAAARWVEESEGEGAWGVPDLPASASLHKRCKFRKIGLHLCLTLEN